MRGLNEIIDMNRDRREQRDEHVTLTVYRSHTGVAIAAIAGIAGIAGIVLMALLALPSVPFLHH